MKVESVASGATVYNFEVADNHNYFVGSLGLLVHNKCGHLNTNGARGNFGIYEIRINGVLHKYGKADLDRVTKSSGLPTRLHQQLRKLEKANPGSVVRGKVIEELLNTSTKDVKVVENSYIRNFYDATGIIPCGNAKSFKP